MGGFFRASEKQLVFYCQRCGADLNEASFILKKTHDNFEPHDFTRREAKVMRWFGPEYYAKPAHVDTLQRGLGL
jgi:hypothetical protein